MKTRFAPSPTGKPHVGNIRTALFTYLYAKSKKGQFIVRIEDTDRERLVPEAISYIEKSLDWLGIKPDNEEKIHQSDRLEIYQKYARNLLKQGKAYKCYCSKERLEKLKEEQAKKGQPPGYDSCCRNTEEKPGESYAVRFKIPENPKEVVWTDMVRGKLSIRTDIQEDFIILKSDGYPTYNFANVIDDHDMEITDVVRGEEFIPSTPKHILLYQAFGWEPPQFGHLPVIIGKDKKKLSKRHGDTAILDYREKGYLSSAMVNFLALLGWNDGTTQELFSTDELIKKFSLERVGKAPAVFDLDRLNWINGEKIREMDVNDLLEEIRQFDHKFFEKKDLELVKRALRVMQTRMVTLRDFVDATYFFSEKDYNPKLLVFGKSTKENSHKGLAAVIRELEKINELKSSEEAEKLLKSVVESENLTNGDVFWPVRVALTREEKSPSPGEMLWALGKDTSLKRLHKAIKEI